jgi:phosphatidylinositol-3-phosphatase
MKGNCNLGTSGRYAVKHNPAAYYVGDSDRAACRTDDIPLGSLQSGALRRDIDASTLPAFAFVTPNLCNDTHDCSVRTGDSWLATWIPRIVNGPNFRAGNTLVVLTWDEGVGGANQIPTVVVGPTVRPGTVASVRLDHYALLRTTEDLLGVGRLGAAASAPSLAVAFGL